MAITKPPGVLNPPRYKRLGGYTISLEAAARWASGIEGFELDPINEGHTIRLILQPLFKHYPVTLRIIDEGENSILMFITQWIDFYPGMPPSRSRNLNRCDLDNMVRYLLQTEGILYYEYDTIDVPV